MEATRTVARLRLRAGSAASIRRLLPRLEDALRTAALPDASARLLLVRRWDLGRLPSDVSPQTLSLMLEARFAAAGWTPVHGSQPDAGGARAVWFRDALEAHVVAARRLVAGGALDDWFWPMALPSMSGARTPDERLRAIALSVASLPEAPTALPCWVDGVVTAGGARLLMRALQPGDGHRLLAAAAGAFPSGARARWDPPPRPATGVAAPQQTSDVEPPPAHARQASPAADDRVELLARWLAADRHQTRGPMAGAAVVPADAGSKPAGSPRRDLPRPDASFPVSAGRRAGPASRGGAGAQAGPGAPSSPSPSAAARALRRSERATKSRLRTRTIRPEAIGRETAPATVSSSARDPQPVGGDRWTVLDRVATSAGGLLLLVPLLDRLGFGSWCSTAGFADAISRGSVVAGLFARLLARLEIPPDDPAWTLVAAIAGGDATPWRGGLVGPAADRWLSACRAHMRRQVRVGLADLVRRTAQIAVTPTHVDTYFPLTSADVRIRRAGLDIDPGWVPWFGRVVSFHYER